MMINFNDIPTRNKETSKGEKVENCSCGARCYVVYMEDRKYTIMCEKCKFYHEIKSDSHDNSIKKWNKMKKQMDKVLKHYDC